MKKWLAAIFLLLSIIIVVVYFVVPDTLDLKTSATIPATRQGLYRMLLNQEKTTAWWPGQIHNTGATQNFRLNDYSYSIIDNNISLLVVTVKGPKMDLVTSLYLIPVATEITRIEWLEKISLPADPISRIMVYLRAKHLKKDMVNIAQHMSSYFSKPENIYDYPVQHLVIIDSTFISTIDTLAHYPETAFIYGKIAELSTFAHGEHAQITGFPILNVDRQDDKNFVVRVALPVNKALPDFKDIMQKRMPPKMNILMMEVKGGAAMAEHALEQLKYYVSDHHQTIPGIPFSALVTNRQTEPDTSKWITRIYCPVR